MNTQKLRPLACCALILLGPATLCAQTPPPAMPEVPAPVAPDVTAAPGTTAAPAAGTVFTVTQAQAEAKAGRFDKALAVLQAPGTVPPADAKALQIGIADVQYAWARSLEQDSPVQALPHFQAALAIDRTLRPADAADDLNETGIACEQLGQHNRSVDACRQALTLYEQAGDTNGQAKALDNLAIAYEHLGQSVRAIGIYRRSVALHRQAGDKHGQADALDNLGLTYDALHQYAKAIGFHRQALLLFQQAGDKDGAAEARGNLDLARKLWKGR